MAEKVIFDGLQKTITIKPGVTSINVIKDIYSAWKLWVLTEDGSKWVPALNSDGGAKLTADGTIIAPQFFYMLNEWTLIIDNGLSVTIRTNLYSDPDTGADNILVTLNGSVVQNVLSDAVIVVPESSAELSLQQAIEILQKIKFNQDNDVIVTLDGEEVTTDKESREKSKADIGILL